MKKLKGSYTVEAAFIVPMIIGIVFMILYLLFLYHDYCILQGELTDTVLMKAQGEEIVKDVGNRWEEKLWIMKVTKAEVSKGAIHVTGKVFAKANVSLPFVTFLLNEHQSFETKEKYSCVQPDEIKRFRKEKEGEEKGGK